MYGQNAGQVTEQLVQEPEGNETLRLKRRPNEKALSSFQQQRQRYQGIKQYSPRLSSAGHRLARQIAKAKRKLARPKCPMVIYQNNQL
jgi:hypothetical protein